MVASPETFGVRTVANDGFAAKQLAPQRSGTQSHAEHRERAARVPLFEKRENGSVGL